MIPSFIQTKLRILSSCMVALGLACLAGCSSEHIGAGQEQNPQNVVEASVEELPRVAVARADITSVLVLNGLTYANPDIVIPAPQTGVVRILVDAGEHVKEGELLARIGRERVVAPADGMIQTLLAADGEKIGKDSQLMSLQVGGFAVRAEVPYDVAYRLYSTPTKARTNVTGGPGGLTCTPFQQYGQGESESEMPVFMCLMEASDGILAGLSAKLALNTAEAQNVLTIPVEAVLGDTKQGEVLVVTSEGVKPTTVTLGISDGAIVEVTSGLSEGEMIIGVSPAFGQE